MQDDTDTPLLETFDKNARPARRQTVERLIAAGLLALVALFVFAIDRIEDDTMSPTFVRGQSILATKLPFYMRDPQRGEVVILRNSVDTSRFARRVVGLPGDSVDIRAVQITVNGSTLFEPYIRADLDATSLNSDTIKIRLKQDEYLVLNDNRADFNDGRTWGAIQRDQIVGLAWLVFFPVNDMNWVQHVALDAQ